MLNQRGKAGLLVLLGLGVIVAAGPSLMAAIEFKHSRHRKAAKNATRNSAPLSTKAFSATSTDVLESKGIYRAGENATSKQFAGPGAYSADFEAPTFSLGSIDGQDGWTVFVSGNPAAEAISGANPAGGAQHFRISLDGTIPSGTLTGGFSPDLGPLPSGSSTTSVNVAIGATGGADYDVAGQSPSESLLTWRVNFRFTGPIRVLDDIGGGLAMVDTGAVWTPGVYKNLTVCFDNVGGTIDYFYDGVLIWSQVGGIVGGTRVEQVVLLSDNFQLAETGDFDDLSITAGLGGVCTAGSVCGNGNQEPGETCDGADADLCPGLCQVDCTCPAPVCGNDVKEAGEACDGIDSAACPGQCLPNCTCPGEDCNSTVVVNCGDTLPGQSTAGHVDDYNDVSGCTGFDQFGPDVVYQLDATDDCLVTASVTNVNYDPAIYVLTDCNNPAGSCIAGADVGLNGVPEAVQFAITSGTTYYIVVDGYYAGGGSFDLSVACDCSGLGACCAPDGTCTETLAGDCTVPSNWSGLGTDCTPNLCPQPCIPDNSAVIACSTGPHFLAGNTVGATDTCDDLGGSSADHIWEITITEAGLYNFDMCTNAPGGDPCAFDSFIFLEDSCCGGIGSVLAADDDCPGIGCFGGSLMECISLDPGTYYLVVEGYGPFDEGEYNVTVDCCVAGPDECEDRMPIPCDGSAGANNCASTTGVNDPTTSCTFGADFGSTFFEFVATDTSARIRTDLNSAAGDSGYGVYAVNQADPCDETQWVEVGCSEDEGLGFNGDICVSNLIPGDTYLIMLVSFSAGSCGDYTFDITCPCPAPPANDFCDDAVAVAVPSTTAGTTELSTLDAGFPSPCGTASITTPGVWYKVLGTGNTMTADLCNGATGYDSKLSVYCPDCVTPMCVGGNDDSCGLQSSVTWCSQAGATYLILVHGFGGQVGPFELTVGDNGSACAGGVACLPEGACCNGANCTITTEIDCTNGGGTYIGDDTNCLQGAPLDVYSEQPNIAIPDGDVNGITRDLVVVGGSTIADLNVDLQVAHTWVGDLIVTLTHNATTVTLIDRPGVPASTFGCSQNDYDIILDDEGSGGAIETLCTASMVSPPNYTPFNPMSAFDGMDASGTWTLFISDNEGFDTGTLLGWSLHVSGTAPDGDGDGIIDLCDECPNDPLNDADGDGVCGDVDVCEGFDDNADADGDGVPDGCDVCPGGDDNVDADADGTPDFCDGCPNDAGKTSPGQCGCGVPDDDADGDGVADCNDGCPNDPNKVDPGVCGCGVPETGDSDGDGVQDCVDVCPGVDDAVFAPGCVGAIPTTSQWGLVVLALLLLVGAKVYFSYRPQAGSV